MVTVNLPRRISESSEIGAVIFTLCAAPLLPELICACLEAGRVAFA